MILAIRTDKSEAELYILVKGKIMTQTSWQAHRELADTILTKLDEILVSSSLSQKDLEGIIIFTGEGSFTGLRIGTTVANAIAYSNGIPIVAAAGANWVKIGLENVRHTKPGLFVVPSYHSEPNITVTKKLSLEERPK